MSVAGSNNKRADRGDNDNDEEHEQGDDNDSLMTLKAARAEDRFEWMCPICMSPYDNQYRVPMRVDACYAKPRDRYRDEQDDDERGAAPGCGHSICEVCSLRAIEKAMPCCICRSNVKEYGPDLATLRELVEFADGQYVTMAAQYNDACAKLEPAQADLKKLQDDMAPSMKEAQRLREEAEKTTVELRNLRSQTESLTRSETSLRAEATRYREEAAKLPRLRELLSEAQDVCRTMGEEVIQLRLEMVALGMLDSSHLGLKIERDSSRVRSSIVANIAMGPVTKRTAWAEVAFDDRRISKELRAALRQASEIEKLPTSNASLSHAAPSDAGTIVNDTSPHPRDGSVFLRAGSWADRFLRERTGLAESILDGLADTGQNEHEGAYYRVVPAVFVKEAMTECERINMARHRERERQARLETMRGVVMEQLVSKCAAAPVPLRPGVACIDCNYSNAFDIQGCKQCAGARCKDCSESEELHGCLLASGGDRYGSAALTGNSALGVFVFTYRRHFGSDAGWFWFLTRALFAHRATDINQTNPRLEDPDHQNQLAVASAFQGIYGSTEGRAIGPAAIIQARALILDHVPREFSAEVMLPTVPEVLSPLEVFDDAASSFYQMVGQHSCSVCMAPRQPHKGDRCTQCDTRPHPSASDLYHECIRRSGASGNIEGFSDAIGQLAEGYRFDKKAVMVRAAFFGESFMTMLKRAVEGGARAMYDELLERMAKPAAKAGKPGKPKRSADPVDAGDPPADAFLGPALVNYRANSPTPPTHPIARSAAQPSVPVSHAAAPRAAVVLSHISRDPHWSLPDAYRGPSRTANTWSLPEAYRNPPFTLPEAYEGPPQTDSDPMVTGSDYNNVFFGPGDNVRNTPLTAQERHSTHINLSTLNGPPWWSFNPNP